MKSITAILFMVTALAVSCRKAQPALPSAQTVSVEFCLDCEGVQGVKSSLDDASSISDLDVLVYDSEGSLVADAPVEAQTVAGGFNVSVTLLKGQCYSIGFFASSAVAVDDEYFTVDPLNKTVTVNYAAIPANSAHADAFFGWYDSYQIPSYGGTIPVHLTLSRPFAQIDFLSLPEDIAFAAAADAVLEEADFDELVTTVQVNGVPNVLNLETGEVEGQADVVFLPAVRPSEVLLDGYQWLGCVFVLAPEVQEGDDAPTYPMGFYSGVFENNAFEIHGSRGFVQNAPAVSRNHRTRVKGYVLTDGGVYMNEL